MANELMLLGCGPAGASAAFSPADIAGLVLWLDASEGTYQSEGGSAALADGDPVGEWQDQSGNGNDATQATAGSKPTLQTAEVNGLSALDFDGTDDYLGVPSLGAAGSATTVFCVFRNGSAVTGFRVLVSLSTVECALGDDGAYLDVSFVTTATQTSAGFDAAAAMTAAAAHVLAVRFDGVDPGSPSSYRAWLDGVEQTVSASGPFGGALQNSLGVRSGASNFFDGLLPAVLAYDNAVDPADVALLNTYLLDRYGL